ncbi:MAG: ATP-binding protein [Patescibacteria group bacterium]
MEELHLPWDRATLEGFLPKIISTGEAGKVDLKSSFNMSDIQHQGEFLKDISAIANTYCHHYKNHGFIIFGASANSILYTTFPDNEDHLQATIDDLVKKYIGQFITTHLFIFGKDDKQWGVLVIPPSNEPPHVFIKDIHKRYVGDIYVRNGTTTSKAQPGDFARFFSQRLEEHTYNSQQKIYDVQRQISDLNIKLKKLKVRPSDVSGVAEEKKSVKSPEVIEPAGSVSELINSLLTKEEDAVSKGMFDEVNKINNFLDSDVIPWDIGKEDKEMSTAILSNIGSASQEFWSAIISLVSKDDKGVYDDVLVKVLSYLSRKIESPDGTPYTEWGKSIRYYPLFISLYLISIIAVAKKKDKLLKRVLKLELNSRSHYDEPLPITYVLFFIRRAEGIFHPMHGGYPQNRWIDPVASYTKQLIDKIFITDDPIRDKEREFYIGEYVLCLSPMDVIDKDTQKPMISTPSAGNYLFMSGSAPIITRFLKNDKEWLKKVFVRPLEDLLEEFDQKAAKMSSGFWGDGFQSGAMDAAFPEKKKTIIK